MNSFFTENIGSNVSDANIAKGESKRFVLEMIYPEGETKEITVKFMTSSITSQQNNMDLCGSGLTFVGENFPCLDKTKITPEYSKR